MRKSLTVVPDAKNNNSRWDVVCLGKTSQKIVGELLYSASNGLSLESFHTVDAAIRPEMVPSVVSYAGSVLLELGCRRGETEDRTTGNKDLPKVRTNFGIRTQVYSLVVNN